MVVLLLVKLKLLLMVLKVRFLLNMLLKFSVSCCGSLVSEIRLSRCFMFGEVVLGMCLLVMCMLSLLFRLVRVIVDGLFG